MMSNEIIEKGNPDIPNIALTFDDVHESNPIYS